MKELLNRSMSDKEAVTAVGAVYVTMFGLMCIAGLYSKSENLLTEVKEKALNQTTPSSSETCSGFLDTGCYRQFTQEYCDGQNTMINFKDDVCEDVTLWSYNPTFLETIK